MIRLCKDCRHVFVEPWRARAHEGEPMPDYAYECHHSSARQPGKRSLVTGYGTEDFFYSCSTCRGVPTGSSTLCGQDGRFWEPREP